MNERATSLRGFRTGFTLIELLVVIAIIALLAALLLPAIGRGKISAKSAACKSNLRQLGHALNLYVADYDKYPGNGACYVGGEFTGLYGAGLNWLKPYASQGRFDPNYNLDWFYSSPRTPTVFNCPAVPPRSFSGVLGGPGWTSYDLGYGYNELGTGWRAGNLHLGLGFKIEFTGLDSNGLPLGARRYVTPANVRNPSELIAIGDGGYWLVPNYSGYSRSSLVGQHPERRANAIFCDGHVEFGNDLKWNTATETARRRWNNDNHAHPETW